MARIEPDALPDPEQVYLAGTLREARQVEELLTTRAVDSVTQVEVLGRTTLFRSLRHGDGFYVNAAQAEYCRDALSRAGFTNGIVSATCVPHQNRHTGGFRSGTTQTPQQDDERSEAQVRLGLAAARRKEQQIDERAVRVALG